MRKSAPVNRVEMSSTKLGIITSSTSYQYAKEVFGDQASILKLGMIYPLPKKLNLDFAAKVDKLVVIEELDAVIEEHCRELGLEVKRQGYPAAGGRILAASHRAEAWCSGTRRKQIADAIRCAPPVMCAGCPHRGMFYTLHKNKVTVMGDIGCYTLGAAAPLSAIDVTACMGASITALHGYNKALNEGKADSAVAIIGDSTFMHSGMTGLANIAYNQSNSTVIILDNSITGMTGHQQNPTTGYNIKGDPAGKIDLESLCRAMGIGRVRVVDPYDLAACDKALKEELAAPEASVIISRRPCVLLKYVKTKPPVKVNVEKCVGCRSCMGLGCPAISIKNKKAVVDNTLCVGCGVCEQLCPVNAFEHTEEAC